MWTGYWKGHDVETKEVSLLGGEGHEADHRNANPVLRRNGEGLVALFTPVELTPSAQAVDVVNELSHHYVQIEVTITHPLTLTWAAPLVVTETRTSLGHDYVLGRHPFHFQILATLHRASVLGRETDLQGQGGHLRNAHLRSGAHLPCVGQEKRVNLLRPATVRYPASKTRPENTQI